MPSLLIRTFLDNKTSVTWEVNINLKRELQCIALSGEGEALIDFRNTDRGMPSPGKLLGLFSLPIMYSLSLVFADLGHHSLFDKGVLHRDISSWNVLRYSVPIECPALDKYCSSYISFF